MDPALTWQWLGLIALVLAGRLAVIVIALRGSKPSERPAIIRALGVLFTPWQSRPEDGGATPVELQEGADEDQRS